MERKTDSGVYTCNVSNIAGSVAGNITINVEYPPSGVTLQGPTSPVQESASVDLTCTATGGNPVPNLNITRTPGGSTVKQGVSPLTYSLSVTKTDNQAEYQCTATGAGIPTPMISNKVRLNVILPPSGPVLTSQPTAINNIVTVQENSPLTITCNSSQPGATGLSYKWSGVNLSGQSNNKLSFTRISKTDSGVYTCNVSNIAGSVAGSITINVEYPPSGVTLQGPTSPVQESASVDLTCTATGGNPVPTLTITRTRGGSTVKQGVSPLTYSTSVTKTDNQAEYQCTATGAGIPTPMISNQVRLNVIFPPSSVTLQGPTSPVQESASVDLTCTTTGGNPEPNLAITRTPGGSTVKKGVSPLTYSTSVNKTDNQAEYQCTATGAGIPTPMFSNKIILTVNFTATALIMMKTPADNVLVNNNQQIECKTDSSNPAAQIQWFTYSSTTWTLLDPQPATNRTTGTNHGFVATSTLSITATKTMNQARYRCQTGNLNKNTTITVHFPPESMTLTEIPSGPVVQGTSKTLTCTTDSSNPVSTILWAYSSGATTWINISPSPPVNHLESHSGQISTSSLVVSTDKDKNGRQYRCTAYQNSQPVNGVTNSTTLSILYAPKLSPQLVEPIAANIGENIRYTINYDANPQATTLNCSHNSTNGKHLMKNTSLTQWDVTIQSVQASDYGSYSCKLNNSVGSVEVTLKLTETGPPQTPSNLRVIARTAVSVTLSWMSEFEGGAEQTFAVSYRAWNSVSAFVNKTEITDPGYKKLVQTKITGLKPATDYQFKVKSVNSNPGDNTSPFTDIVTTNTNAIPSAINTALKQATVTQKGNSVLINLSSFPSKYSVYVKYCIKHTNECFNSTKLETTGGPISIEIKIDPDQAYSYQLIVTESSDVILSHQVEIPVTTYVTLIGGVVVGVVLVTIIVIVFVLLFVKRRRDGQWIWTKNRSESPASVPPPNDNDIDGFVVGPRGDKYARVNKKPKSPPTKDNHVTTDDFDPYSNIGDLVSEDGVEKTGEPIYAQVDKKKKRNQNQVMNGASGTDPIYSNVDKSKKKKTKVVNGASGTDPIYSNVDKSKKKKTKGSVDSAEPLYAQVDKNKTRKGKKAKKAETNGNYEMENPYQTIGDKENPYQDVYNDDDGDIVKYVNCGVDNPAFNADDVEELRKEPIYLHVVNNVKIQAPPGVLIGDFDDFSTYSELGRVVEPQVQAELVARLEAEEAERRRQREEKEQQEKSC
ncbi:synaptogenesis protein syg-2-like [Tubulanus polymorphus]|uniref:synaptogenesis protein syg-2-like n=1 Tax=Tubulanus polymorphus TaxID=672921 RepID=UPI003DA1DBF6